MVKSIVLLLATLFTLAASAQKRQISGKITDQETKEAMMQVTVQLLKTDSTFVAGVTTNDDGQFNLAAPSDGRFILKLSSVGYNTLFHNLTVANSADTDLGELKMKASAISLRGTTVTGHAAKVVLSKDTFIYNASAYRTPEGSTIEELVKRLPGATVSDDGKITINGQEVKKIKVDGKEFMLGDTKTAMKNLPTSIVNKVKAYKEKSDLARVSGINDGKEQTVLDFGLKQGMNKGLFSNADLSYGNHDRYSERLMGAYFNSNFRNMLFANANNTNDRGFSGGGGRGNFGRGRNGLNTSKMAAYNFNYDDSKRLRIDGNVSWYHSNNDAQTKNSTQNFVSSKGSFSNSIGQQLSRTDSWNGQLGLEWKPDTLTNIIFRPSISVTTSDGRNINRSASFNVDPYLYSTDPLASESIAAMAKDSMAVNSNQANSISYSQSKNFSGSLQLNRRLSSLGRNITLRFEGGYSDGDSKSLSTNNVHLYQIRNAAGADSTYQTNRYNLTPTRNWNYSVQATYSEPLAKSTYLQFSYTFSYNYSKSDRSTYNFSNLGEDFFDGLSPVYRGWGSYLSRLQNPLESYLDSELSRYARYQTLTHEAEIMYRMIREKYNFNVGMMVQPLTSHFKQDYQGLHTDTTRSVVNFTPTLDFSYQFNNVSELRVNYRGSTTQPDMNSLLDITDDSDPLNITKGNPGLKPSFTNNFQLFYNTYVQKRQQAIMAFVNYSNTRNSISNKVTYDDKTGGRIMRPENINGNWNVNGSFMFNTAIDTAAYWNVNTSTDLGYNNYVSYLSTSATASSEKNTTRSLDISERLAASYRNSWLEVELDGSFNFTHTRNRMQAQANLDTWQFAYGATVNLTAPWGTSLSTDLHQNSRRGYNDKSMNTNELVWNAQLSQAFLSNKALTVSLQLYDILHNQSNFSRTINAMQRSDTEYNSINSYAMLHVAYRFNLFGGRPQRRGMGPGGRGRGMRPPRGMRPMRGGFGGPRF